METTVPTGDPDASSVWPKGSMWISRCEAARTVPRVRCSYTQYSTAADSCSSSPSGIPSSHPAPIEDCFLVSED
eukprot:2150087-Pyramimonas_sp.AAC.1